ncbi:MAG: DUF302 domain-containing protein [Candidatus Bipolaricaulota bacterium]
MVEVLKKKLDAAFDDAVARVQEAVSDEFSVLMVKSIDEVIKTNLELPDYPLKYTVILACGPELAKMALDLSLETGTLMPCSFVVYQKDDEVFAAHTSIMKTAVEVGMVPENEMQELMEKTGEKVHKVWEKLED